MAGLGKLLVMLGLMLAVAGACLWGFGSLGFVGRLPGDIYIRRGNFTFYFPLATSILLSVVLTLLFSLFRR